MLGAGKPLPDFEAPGLHRGVHPICRFGNMRKSGYRDGLLCPLCLASLLLSNAERHTICIQCSYALGHERQCLSPKGLILHMHHVLDPIKSVYYNKGDCRTSKHHIHGIHEGNMPDTLVELVV